jgi:sodium-dependent dicarboxylate transporter 2/3/5
MGASPKVKSSPQSSWDPAILVLGVSAVMKSTIPGFTPPHKTAVLLTSTILFFATGLLDINDLEEIPWNIILLFAGAMSIGFCLWQTGAAEWMAVNWLTMFKESSGFVFIMSIAFFVMMMTNFIMNVAAIAISLPVALVIAPYLGVAGEVIVFSSLVVAGMPFSCWWAPHPMPSPTTPSSSPPASFSCGVFRPASF